MDEITPCVGCGLYDEIKKIKMNNDMLCASNKSLKKKD
jgi:hypothetical protein